MVEGERIRAQGPRWPHRSRHRRTLDSKPMDWKVRYHIHDDRSAENRTARQSWPQPGHKLESTPVTHDAPNAPS